MLYSTPFHIMYATNKISDYYILDRFLRIVLSTQFRNVDLSRHGKYNFRCNVCGDSLKSTKKKRGWILPPRKDSPAMFKCWNGCTPMPAEVWLKKFFPLQYREYIKECLRSSVNSTPSITTHLVKKVEDENKISSERIELDKFVHILSGSGELFDKAIDMCRRRKISDNVWKKFFVATSGRYAERMIIPFYDDDNKIYYFQGRSLTNREPKYLNRTENKKDSVYNYYNIDRTKPVIVVEGPLDSTFIENSVAVLGLDFSDETRKKLSELDCYYLLDNDKAGRTASDKLLKEGEKVFLWTRFIESNPSCIDCKDVNDVILKLNLSTVDFSFFENKKWWGLSMYDAIYL